MFVFYKFCILPFLKIGVTIEYNKKNLLFLNDLKEQ